jgi:hypothetical protein
MITMITKAKNTEKIIPVIIRMPESLHSDIIKENASKTVETGVAKSLNSSLVEMLTKAVKKSKKAKV